jgi:putative transposase
MRKSRFSETQIIGILKQAEAGAKVQDLAREHGVSVAMIYKWRQKFDGLDVNEAKRLRELEAENGKLKRLVADLSLDVIGLKSLLEKSGKPHRETRSGRASARRNRSQRTTRVSFGGANACRAALRKPARPSRRILRSVCVSMHLSGRVLATSGSRSSCAETAFM